MNRLKSKASRFFRKQNNKALPPPPFHESLLYDILPVVDGSINGRGEALGITVPVLSAAKTDKPLPSCPSSIKKVQSETSLALEHVTTATTRKPKPAALVLKKRPSLATLRESSSRLFQSNTGDHGPPPPPMPQIPVDTPTPKPRLPLLRPRQPVPSARSGRSSRSSPGSSTSTFPPASSTSPRPPRPPRPKSLDDETLFLLRDGNVPMIFHTPHHARTPTISTSSSAHTRLGLPSGRSSVSSPTSPLFDSPLAASFPRDPNQPLPFRGSSGSVRGYGRFSAYVKARQQYGSGGYGDGVDVEDRDVGPVELYRASRCADWSLERRVSGKLGERGMLFRGRAGAWHFVADV